MENNVCSNQAEMIGFVEDEPIFNHELFGEKFYTFTLRIPRLSGINDYIKIMASDRLMTDFSIEPGKEIEIIGQFRSYNSYQDGENRLILTVFAKDLKLPDPNEVKNPNSLYLNGFVCKEPVYRTTPFGREITDLLLAVNRTYNKSDYIPIIAWGRNARYCRSFHVGDRVKIWGRVQSREYQKRIDDDTSITKTAYEVSISKLELVEDD
jgi:primosomal replication protein N